MFIIREYGVGSLEFPAFSISEYALLDNEDEEATLETLIDNLSDLPDSVFGITGNSNQTTQQNESFSLRSRNSNSLKLLELITEDILMNHKE